jgi:DNA processing protein
MSAGCCDACTRRSRLVGRLAGHLEQRRADRVRIREVLALPDERLIEALGGLLAGEIAAEHAATDPDAVRAAWRAAGMTAVCRHAAGYPAGLSDLSDAPAVLHVNGDPGRLTRLLGAEAPAVAVVGARRASADGLQLAADLGRGLAAAGVSVISGMALGIDSAAHRGALEAPDPRTVAVLACGPEIAYPASRRRLHAELADRALVVSELPPGTPAYRWAFPARNRLIAALAGMTVVVEAAERSGSLITADLAADLGRDIGAVPGSPASWHAGGTNALLRDGAHVVRGARDVLDDVFGPRPADAGEQAGAGLALGDDLRALAEAVARGHATIASLVAAGNDPGAVLAGLTELELLGVLERRPGGRYVVGTA